MINYKTMDKKNRQIHSLSEEEYGFFMGIKHHVSSTLDRLTNTIHHYEGLVDDLKKEKEAKS